MTEVRRHRGALLVYDNGSPIPLFVYSQQKVDVSWMKLFLSDVISLVVKLSLFCNTVVFLMF